MILLVALLFIGMCLMTVHPARAAASAEIQNDSMWINSVGTLCIFGEIKNTGDVWLRFVEVIATLRDATGSCLIMSPSSPKPAIFRQLTLLHS